MVSLNTGERRLCAEPEWLVFQGGTAVQAQYPTFAYESPAVFYVDLPNTTTGACPPLTAPVYRLWNQRSDSNHRYTIDPAVKAQMIAKGYVAEGYGPDAVIMCYPL
jgi:hypothetical protein